MEGPNGCDQIALFAFHSFLVQFQTNAGYTCTGDKGYRLLLFPATINNINLHQVFSSYGSTGKLLGCQLFENLSIHDE